MDITNGKRNLLRLWVESFVVVNKCTGQLLQLALGLGFVAFLIGLVVRLIVQRVGMEKIAMIFFTQSIKLRMLGILGAVIAIFIAYLVLISVAQFIKTIFQRIVSAKALNQNQPLSDALLGSLLPTIYQLVTGFLLAIPLLPISLGLDYVKKIHIALWIICSILLWLVLIRFIYTFISMAVDGKCPIEGITHSWNLTGENYVDSLLLGIMLYGSMVLFTLCATLVLYGLRIIIPLYFAESFSLAHPSLIWWLVGIVLALVGLFFYLAILAFPVLVYLNRNSIGKQPLPASGHEDSTIFIPLPDLDIPLQQVPPAQEEPQIPAPEQTEQMESMPSTPVPPQNPEPIAVPANQGNVHMQTLEEIGVEKTSVNTTEEDTNEITQHLHKVYSPRPEDVIQRADEDRMPTILFDDDLAKQLQGDDVIISQQQSPKTDELPNEDGDDTVQLSK